MPAEFHGRQPRPGPSGNLTGFQILAPEEELARQLLLSLDQDQRGRALFLSEAPADILTQNLPRVRPETRSA